MLSMMHTLSVPAPFTTEVLVVWIHGHVRNQIKLQNAPQYQDSCQEDLWGGSMTTMLVSTERLSSAAWQRHDSRHCQEVLDVGEQELAMLAVYEVCKEYDLMQHTLLG